MVQRLQRWSGSVRGDTTLELCRPVLNQYPTATVGSSVRAVEYRHSYSTKRIQPMPQCLHIPAFHDNEDIYEHNDCHKNIFIQTCLLKNHIFKHFPCHEQGSSP
jgi:hypothetical protein